MSNFFKAKNKQLAFFERESYLKSNWNSVLEVFDSQIRKVSWKCAHNLVLHMWTVHWHTWQLRHFFRYIEIQMVDETLAMTKISRVQRTNWKFQDPFGREQQNTQKDDLLFCSSRRKEYLIVLERVPLGTQRIVLKILLLFSSEAKFFNTQEKCKCAWMKTILVPLFSIFNDAAYRIFFDVSETSVCLFTSWKKWYELIISKVITDIRNWQFSTQIWAWLHLMQNTNRKFHCIVFIWKMRR